MFPRAVLSLSFACSVATACGGVSPDPVAIALAADDLPVTVDDAARSAAAELAESAIGHAAADDFDAAERDARDALDADPRSARARAVLGRCLLERAREESPPELTLWREAEGELLAATRLAPDDPVVGLLHANFLVADGHASAAVHRLDELLAEHPDDSDLLWMAGSIHYDSGDELAAIERLSAYVVLVPNDARAWFRLAQSRLRRVRVALDDERRRAEWTAAAVRFAGYRRLRPVDPAGWIGEAHARFALLGDTTNDTAAAEEAAAILELFERAAPLDKTSPRADHGRGVVLERLARAADARAAYESALARDPDHLPSILNLAASLATAERDDEARPLYRHALTLSELTDGERAAIETWLAERDDPVGR